MRTRVLVVGAMMAALQIVAAAPAVAGDACKTVLPGGTLIAGTPYVSSSHSLIGYVVGDHKVLVGEYAEPNAFFPDPLVSITARGKDGFSYVSAQSPTGAIGSGTSSGWTKDDWLQQSKQFAKCMDKRSP